MASKNDEMSRSVTQAMYKYLPGAWIDFYVKSTRSTYAAKVVGWNSEILISINETRLLEKVKMSIEAFERMGGETDGFGETSKIGIENYEIRTPKLGVNPDIITEVSPLSFYCSKCNKVHRIKSSGDVSKEKVMLSSCCKKPLKQIALVYTCECGWSKSVEPLPCPNKEHGFEHMRYNGKFGYTCTKCNKLREIFTWCDRCNAKIYPKNALDNINFMPFSVSTIDLINMKEEEFLLEEKEAGAKVILAKWLGELEEERYKNFIHNGVGNKEDEGLRLQYQTFLQTMIDSGLPLEQAEEIAKQAVYQVGQNVLGKIEGYFNTHITTRNNGKLNQYAANILEYYRILNGEDGVAHISTIEDAKRISKQLGTSTEYNRFDEIVDQLGIKKIQVCNNVPFVSSTYGFTRKSNDPNSKSGSSKLMLQAFPKEGKVKNTIYAIKLKTEGILVEFDRVKILEWLIKNKFISENDLPVNMADEKCLKEWFINKIDPSVIDTFSTINKLQSVETFYVYNLLHSMSHALIKQAGEMCGLDKNSLSEYIFPQVPAIFIYCQNSQGLSLGALYNLFEAYLDKWLQFAVRGMEKCIFDPICLERDKACAGCLYLNEVSCVHFNKDLDRSFLIGRYDKATGKRVYGFWEGVL